MQKITIYVNRAGNPMLGVARGFDETLDLGEMPFPVLQLDSDTSLDFGEL